MASCLFTHTAWGQACCAGAGALTPGRLQLHEDALVGTQLHAGVVLGSFDAKGTYAPTGPHYAEDDYEEDLFGAVRVFQRGQVALLVPFIETYRSESGTNELGGGIGDVNLSLRYDFILAAESKIVPGIAVLAGITAPTGTPADAYNPSKPLDTDTIGEAEDHWEIHRPAPDFEPHVGLGHPEIASCLRDEQSWSHRRRANQDQDGCGERIPVDHKVSLQFGSDEK